MVYDGFLGAEIKTVLENLGIETPRDVRGLGWPRQDIIASRFADIMSELGLDFNDDSLRGTPDRISRMYCTEIFTGLDYSQFPQCTTVENKVKYDELISCKASVMSVCEHHFVPFMGHAHVAYIPQTKIIGLSKINRIVDFFSRRPQIQERLTIQIYAALQHILQTPDIAVVIQAEHLCVRLRGVKDQLSSTTTAKMGGKFMSVAALRSEFLALTR